MPEESESSSPFPHTTPRELVLKALRISGTATQLKARTGLQFYTTYRALRELIQEGLVTKIPKGRGYIYHLNR